MAETFLEDVGGNLVAKTKIVDRNYQEASWLQLMIRTLVKYPPFLVFLEVANYVDKKNWYGVRGLLLAYVLWGLLIAGMTLAGKKAPHDLAAGTQVVVKKEESKKKEATGLLASLWGG